MIEDDEGDGEGMMSCVRFFVFSVAKERRVKLRRSSK